MTDTTDPTPGDATPPEEHHHPLAHRVTLPLGMSGDALVFAEGSEDDEPPELVSGQELPEPRDRS
jgi:hypothetical protein